MRLHRCRGRGDQVSPARTTEGWRDGRVQQGCPPAGPCHGLRRARTLLPHEWWSPGAEALGAKVPCSRPHDVRPSIAGPGGNSEPFFFGRTYELSRNSLAVDLLPMSDLPSEGRVSRASASVLVFGLSPFICTVHVSARWGFLAIVLRVAGA